MRVLKKLNKQKLIGILWSFIAIIIFFGIYSLIGRFCIVSWLKSALSICISVSTSALFYFIGKKVNNNSAKRYLTERYVFTFQHIRIHLERDEECWRNKYNKENQGSVQNPNPYLLMMENEEYIFVNLDDESEYLYRDILKGYVDKNLLREKVAPLINKMLKPYKELLSKDIYSRHYNFDNPKKVLDKLKKCKK